MGYFVKNRVIPSGSSGVRLPTGTSANRPANPAFGLMRFNTETGFIEYFNGIEFISVSAGGNVVYDVDSFTGDGSTTVFTMSEEEATASQIIVFVGSIYQDSTSAYTVDGSFDITFTSAPPDGEPISVIHSTV
jgi:hypothetical protein